MFGKQFLRSDSPTVFHASEIPHVDELVETTDLLVHSVDLLHHLLWRADEGETIFTDLFIGHLAKLLEASG